MEFCFHVPDSKATCDSMPGSFPPTHTAEIPSGMGMVSPRTYPDLSSPMGFRKTLVLGSRSPRCLNSKLTSKLGVVPYVHSDPPTSPRIHSADGHRPCPRLCNNSNTNDLHQIFWELDHLRAEKKSGGLRAGPPSHWLSPLLLPCFHTLEVSAKSLPLSQKHSAHTPAPQELSFSSPSSRGIFQSKYISLSERNSSANFNKNNIPLPYRI